MKKNPLIQNFAGAPLSIHFYINFNLSIKSKIHDPNYLSERNEIYFHAIGILLSNKELNT